MRGSCLPPDQAPIPIGQLRDYIAYARGRCHPQLSPEAAEDIIEGYMNMRRMGSSRKARPLRPSNRHQPSMACPACRGPFPMFAALSVHPCLDEPGYTQASRVEDLPLPLECCKNMV